MTGSTILILAAVLAAPAAYSAARGETLAAHRQAGGLEVRVDTAGRALVLANRGTEGIYVQIFERRLAALADWVPCRDPSVCPPLPPGGGMRVAFDSIAGYQADARDVVVYWWTLNRAPGGTFQPDAMRSVIILVAAEGR